MTNFARPQGETVSVVPHDSRWFAAAEQEIARLQATLDGSAVRIEHVGSTAVTDLPAKPVIDLQISIADQSLFGVAARQLSAAGYAHVPVEGFEDYPFYRRRDDAGQVLHVHLCVAASHHERRHLAIRDYLRTNEGARRAYGELKRNLVAQHNGDRASYIAGKDEFVRRLEQLAFAPDPSVD